jgi:hypothetical protein
MSHLQCNACSETRTAGGDAREVAARPRSAGLATPWSEAPASAGVHHDVRSFISRGAGRNSDFGAWQWQLLPAKCSGLDAAARDLESAQQLGVVFGAFDAPARRWQLRQAHVPGSPEASQAQTD